MIKQAEQLAAPKQQLIIETASGQMQSLQQSELHRIQALAEVNPNIRQEEIDHISTETIELQKFLDSAQIKLEALRVAIVTD